jgi:hypothetical protein
MDTIPAIITQSIFLEDSRILRGNDDVEQLCDKMNQTVEMVDEAGPVQQEASFQIESSICMEPSIQIEASMLQEPLIMPPNPLYQTYALPSQSPVRIVFKF